MNNSTYADMPIQVIGEQNDSGWLRLHHSILHYPKLQLLAAVDFKLWINLLIIADKAPNRKLPPTKRLAFSLRMRQSTLIKCCDRLISTGLLLRDAGGELSVVYELDDRGKHRCSTHEWNCLRKTVFRRDDYTCFYCGKRAVRLECDHVVPFSRGGSDELSNLVTACFSCNRAKRSKALDEFLGRVN